MLGCCVCCVLCVLCVVCCVLSVSVDLWREERKAARTPVIQ